MAEFIIEFILDIIIEGSLSICENKKVSKWIRYPLIFLVSLIGFGIIGLLIAVSFNIMTDSLVGGLVILAIGIICLVYMIRKVVEICKEKKTKLNSLSNQASDTSVSTDEASSLTPSSDFFYYNNYNDEFKNN